MSGVKGDPYEISDTDDDEIGMLTPTHFPERHPAIKRRWSETITISSDTDDGKDLVCTENHAKLLVPIDEPGSPFQNGLAHRTGRLPVKCIPLKRAMMNTSMEVAATTMILISILRNGPSQK
jgi:hypothetical protein